MALDTVQDYIDGSRALLLDTVEPYRYPDADLVFALDLAIMESRKLRPDLWVSSFSSTLPQYSGGALAASVAVDPQYRSAFLYYMCGQVQLRDDENSQDTRAAAFMARFVSALTTMQV